MISLFLHRLRVEGNEMVPVTASEKHKATSTRGQLSVLSVVCHLAGVFSSFPENEEHPRTSKAHRMGCSFNLATLF